MILIISTAHNEGTGAYVMLSEYLTALSPEKRKEYVVVTPMTSLVGTTVKNLGVEHFPLSTNSDTFFSTHIQFKRIMPQLRRPDLVVAWHSRGFDLAVMCAKKWSCKTVGIIHDHPETPVHGKIRKKIIHWASKRLDGLIAVSRAVAVPWTDMYPYKNLEVIHNGLNSGVGYDVGLRKNKNSVVVGFLGGGAKTKGVEIILDWIEKSDGMNLEWELYGGGLDKIENDTRIINNKGKERVKIMGRRPRDFIFSRIDILVHASTFFDPYPTVILEAQRAGLPCIGSILGGAVEIIEHGRTGYIFDPGRPDDGFRYLLSLSENSDIYQELADSAAKSYEQNHTIGKMIEGYERFFVKTLNL